MKFFLLLTLLLSFCGRFVSAQIQNTLYFNLFDDVGFNSKTIDLNKPVGVTSAEANVNQSGSSTYSIPIAIPVGTNGMQPNLILSYNSQGGKGLLGYGWNLNVGSVITRGVKTKLVDDEARGVGLNNNDAYYLD